MKTKTTSSGVDLYAKAKTIIPGGTQLLSKRPERFLPGIWPAYYRKASGCEVWDLDGNHFYDFAQMGVGSCILGYADEEVNAAVVQCINHGSMCTLNCWEEVALAEKLVELHPWARKVRFARTGGEACSVAIRIARAATNKTVVAFCGYHGWHDWYLSANLSNRENLDGQLLPGLTPKGVPRQLAGTSVPFHFNDLASLDKVVAEYGHDLAAIIIEPERGNKPTPEFLNGVRNIANNLNAVLIFDEVTSGFRICNGGIHLTLGVNPDIAIFGKALGNGFPISAIVGKSEVMDAAQDSFISSTFWTERIGYVAALATLEKIEKYNVTRELCDHGNQLIEGLVEISERAGISLKISGIPPLIYMRFDHQYSQEMQTYWSQEMLKAGFLLGGAIYTSYAYDKNINDKFLEATSKVFCEMRKNLDETCFNLKLDGPVIQSGFKRLT